MVFEYVWNVAGWGSIVALGPIAVSASLSMNPFSSESPKGWAYRYTKNIADKSHERAKPVGIPVWLSTLLYAIVAACLVVPLMAIHYNSGAYNGWAVRPLPIAFTLISLAANVLWMVVYLSKCSACTNIGWVQILSILSSVIGFIYILDNTKILYAMFALPFMVWNIMWFAKNYVEDMFRCDFTSGLSKCSTYTA